jgi:hypothetical protein
MGIVYMGGCFPGVIGILDFMTGCTKLRGRCPDHGVVTDTEKGKPDDDTDNNEDAGNKNFFFHGVSCCLRLINLQLFNAIALRLTT